jgi:hypothetical protein
MVRLLLEDVTLCKDEVITAQVRFKGGAVHTMTLPISQGRRSAKASPHSHRSVAR